MPSQEHLYIITASNEDAKEHVRKSIANPIDPAICAAHFPNDVLDDVRRKSTDGNFYAWGARPGKRNEPNGNALQEATRGAGETSDKNALAQHAWEPSDQPDWLTPDLFTKENSAITCKRSHVGHSIINWGVEVPLLSMQIDFSDTTRL